MVCLDTQQLRGWRGYMWVAMSEHDSQDSIEDDPLVRLFGTHAKTKILAVLATAERPLGVTTICERAGFGDRHSWYDYRDDLLGSGLVVEAGQEGRSTLYALADPDADPRAEWLEQLRDATAAHLREHVDEE